MDGSRAEMVSAAENPGPWDGGASAGGAVDGGDGEAAGRVA